MYSFYTCCVPVREKFSAKVKDLVDTSILHFMNNHDLSYAWYADKKGFFTTK